MARGFWIGYSGDYEDWEDLSDVVEKVSQEWVVLSPNTFHSETSETLVVGDYLVPGLILEARGWVDGPNLSDVRSRIGRILSRGHRILQQAPYDTSERQFVRLEDDSGYRLALCRLVGVSVPEWNSSAPVEIAFRLLCSVPRSRSAVTTNLTVPPSNGTWQASSIPNDDGEVWSHVEWILGVGSSGGNYDVEFKAYGEQGRGSRVIRVQANIPANQFLYVHGGVSDFPPFIGLWDGSSWVKKPEFYHSGWFPTMRVGAGRSVEVKVNSGSLSNITTLQAVHNRRYYHL